MGRDRRRPKMTIVVAVKDMFIKEVIQCMILNIIERQRRINVVELD